MSLADGKEGMKGMGGRRAFKFATAMLPRDYPGMYKWS